jgi:hypothetical protein
MFCFDDRLIMSHKGAALCPPEIKKHGPVLPDITYGGEKWRQCVFSSSVMRAPGGGFRMYSSCLSQSRKRMFIGVHESADGMKWDKICPGKIKYAGETTHFLKIQGADTAVGHIQPSVILMPDGSWRMFCWMHGEKIRYICCESSDGLKWKCLSSENPCLYHPNDSAVGFACVPGLVPYSLMKNTPRRNSSPAGTNRIKRLISNDATFTYFNTRTGEFEMYSVWLLPNCPETGRYFEHDNAPLCLRTIHRRTSKNGADWSDPELLVTPDKDDPLSRQFYYLAANSAGGWRTGFLGSYNCAGQTMDIELAWSRDGIKWERKLRQPWLKRGEAGQPDSKMIKASHSLLRAGDKFLLYYSGDDVTHNARARGEMFNTKVMLAEFGKNRFAGLRAAAGKTALIETAPFILRSDTLRVNGSFTGGLLAELCDSRGRVLKKHSFDDSDIIKGDSTARALSWRGGKDLSRHKYEAFTLRLKLYRGIIHEICFEPEADERGLSAG